MERYLAQERPLRALGHERLRGLRLLERGDREADLRARKYHEGGLRPNPVGSIRHDGGHQA
jgi:hypothetical protein